MSSIDNVSVNVSFLGTEYKEIEHCICKPGETVEDAIHRIIVSEARSRKLVEELKGYGDKR